MHRASFPLLIPLRGRQAAHLPRGRAGGHQGLDKGDAVGEAALRVRVEGAQHDGAVGVRQRAEVGLTALAQRYAREM